MKGIKFVVSIIFSVFLLNCGTKLKLGEGSIITPIDTYELPSRGFFMGILPTPGEGQDFSQSYYQASLYAEFSPVWGKPTPFYDLAEDLSGEWGDVFVTGYIRGNGMFPLIHMNFYEGDAENLVLVKPPGLEDATLSDSEWRHSYLSSALAILYAVRPLYFSLGNEVNRWYELYGTGENPNGFQYFVSLYREIYDTLKSISPETKVLCTFAREIVTENREADLTVLEYFNGYLDILVFTTYPFSVQGILSPSDIPDEYFLRAFDHIGSMPIGFSELSWIVHESFGGEKGQADFLRYMVGRLTIDQGIDLKLLGWAWLHDLPGGDSTGLITYSGKEREAYTVWKEIYTSSH